MPPASEKRCPYCEERIPARATRCRFCHELLPEDNEEEAERPQRRSTAIQEGRSAVPRRPVQSDDDDDDDQPRRRRLDEDNEDEEGEDRPRRRRRSRRGKYAECPNCGCPGHATRVGFTWWGGVLGPALFTHVRCRDCATCYNGKTGNYNTTAIAIYLSVGLGVAFLFMIVGFFLTLGK
jgi:hypothetical protein